jgi:O-antigen ligase
VRIIFENPGDTASLNDERLGIWRSAINVIQKYPLIGVGTGDSFDKLENEFKLLGYTQGFYKNLNAHNQYLETLISSGVIGLLFFLVIFGVMIFFAIKDRNTLYGVFIIMMLIFFIFESMLERLAGVSFFSLFSFLLMHLKYPVQESAEK